MTDNLSAYIDRLGLVKAQLATLKREEDDLKAILIEQGPGAYEGDLFRVTVSETERQTLNMEAVRAKLSPAFIAANTLVTDVVTVRVVARNGRKAA